MISKRSIIYDLLQESNVVLVLYKKCLNGGDIAYLGQQKVKKIRKLYLNFNNINGKDLQGWVKADWCNLTTLYLSSNKIGDIGCKYLTQCSLKKLKQLDLEQNDITTIGIMHLYKLNVDLNFLILNRNHIGIGCGKWLNSIIGLQTLKLRHNKLRDIDLIDIVLTNQKLKDLQIRKKELIASKANSINKIRLNHIFNEKFRQIFFDE